ncbi:MAG: hypothetical protein VB137_01755 [Burkholderia sp.]
MKAAVPAEIRENRVSKIKLQNRRTAEMKPTKKLGRRTKLPLMVVGKKEHEARSPALPSTNSCGFRCAI